MNRQLFGIFLVTSLGMVGVFNISPALPFIAEGMSIDTAQIAQIISAFTLGNVVVAPFVGLLSDKLGRRKVLFPSLYLFAFAGAGCGFSQNFEQLLLLRFLHGVGAAGVGVLAVTMIADLYQGSNRVRLFGYNMVVASVGMVIFPLLGSWLVTYSWRYPFFLAALAFPVAIYNQLFLRYQEPVSHLDTRNYLLQLAASMKDRRVLPLVYLNISVFVVFGGAFLSFYALFLTQAYPQEILFAGIGLQLELLIGVCMALFSVMVGVVSSKLGAIHQRFGFNKVLSLAFIAYGAALLLFVSSEWIFLTALSVMLLGAAHGILAPSIIALHTKLAPEGMTAAYVTLNSLVFRLGQTIGPLIMAAVFISQGISSVFIAASLLLIPAVLVSWLTPWRPALAA